MIKNSGSPKVQPVQVRGSILILYSFFKKRVFQILFLISAVVFPDKYKNQIFLNFQKTSQNFFSKKEQKIQMMRRTSTEISGDS